MADAIQTKKLKNPYVDWRNRPYATNAGTEEKRRQAAAWEALNLLVRQHNGWVTSPPGKVLRIEVMKDSELPAKLRELRYNVVRCGSVTRVTGAPASNPVTERTTGAVPSAFCELDVIEIRLDGR